MKLKKERRFHLEYIIYICFIVVGIIFLGGAFIKYGKHYIESQDEQVIHLVNVIDRNIDILLERHKEGFDYITKRRGFIEAEKNWLEKGDTSGLNFYLGENMIARDEMTAGMLALKDNQIILSTNGTMSYHFLENAEDNTLVCCVDEKDEIYFACVYQGNHGINYAALISLEEFYKRSIGRDWNEQDRIVLSDHDHRVVMYRFGEEFQVKPTEDSDSAMDGLIEEQEILGQFTEQFKKTELEKSYYRQDKDKEHFIRIITKPAVSSDNQVISIGIGTNYESTFTVFQHVLLRLLCYGALVIAGMILLTRTVIRVRHQHNEAALELEILKEQNRVMEELNRRNEELAHNQRLQVIGTLTAGVAHEFNNLLTPIMGYSLMTLETMEEDDLIYDNVLEIYNASVKAKEIIKRMAELSRKNKGSSSTKIKLLSLIQKVEEIAKPVLPSNVSVKVVSEKENIYVTGNETRLIQMMLNLVLNAFQAMEESGGELSINIKEEGNRAVISIKDAGVGIPKEIIENIFDPFFTTKATGRGTGLGLAIVSQVINEHKGEIDVESEPGAGTTFIIRLPMNN